MQREGQRAPVMTHMSGGTFRSSMVSRASHSKAWASTTSSKGTVCLPRIFLALLTPPVSASAFETAPGSRTCPPVPACSRGLVSPARPPLSRPHPSSGSCGLSPGEPPRQRLPEEPRERNDSPQGEAHRRNEFAKSLGVALRHGSPRRFDLLSPNRGRTSTGLRTLRISAFGPPPLDPQGHGTPPAAP